MNDWMDERAKLTEASRVVVKIGTRVVTESGAGLDDHFLDGLAGQIAELKPQIVVVTSGAVHLGQRALRARRRADSVSLRQAAAAVGQPQLMRHYAQALTVHGLTVAQILLTTDDMCDRRRYLRIRNTLETLLDEGLVPVVNENDTVSVEGVTFGENDRLAAVLAAAVRADLLIFLSDQAGLFTADPRQDPDAQLVPIVRPGEDMSPYAATAGGPESRGGMIKKIHAAQMAVDGGIPVVIADGRAVDVLLLILAGEEVGTLFVPKAPMPGRKLWIATAIEPAGQIVVDEGARRALQHEDGSSLLPAGVIAVRGQFQAGDLVTVVTADEKEVARGLVNYSAAEVVRIQGTHSRQIPEILGHVGDEEVIHRDNMALTAD